MERKIERKRETVGSKRYIVDYRDDYLNSPAPNNASSMDGLPMTYFSPGVRAMAKGFHQDSDQYVAYLRLR